MKTLDEDHNKHFRVPGGFVFYLGTTDCNGPDGVFTFYGTNQTAYTNFGPGEGHDPQVACCVIIDRVHPGWLDFYCSYYFVAVRTICEIEQ